VGGRAETVDAEPSMFAGHAVGPVTDESRTEQGRGLDGWIVGRNRQCIASVRHAAFREAAIDVVAGGACLVAEILATILALITATASRSQPRDADSVAVENVEVGAADAAGLDLQENLPRSRNRGFDLALDQGAARCLEDHCSHTARPCPTARGDNRRRSIGLRRHQTVPT
jgi:hypothetical protein